jgi:hypothetical protein
MVTLSAAKRRRHSMVTLSAAKRRSIAILLLMLAAACSSDDSAGVGGAAGLATVIDSTGDSVEARVAGEVPVSAVRTLVEEMRIAPGVDDTTLFTETYEFDVNPKGRLWVYDRPSNSVLLFDPDGRLVRRIGRQGAGPGEFNASSGMVALGDTGFAVWDSRNARVSIFDSSGSFQTSWSTPSGFSTSNGLVTDRSGTLFLKRPVTPPRAGEILGRMGLVRLRAGGVLSDSIAPPDLPVPREVYVAERVYGKDSRSQSSTSSTYAPNYSWGWHPDGYFVAADGGKYEIILARPSVKPVVIRRQTLAVPIAEDEREEERASVLFQMRQTDPGWSWSGPPIPSSKAPLGEISIARDGRIWARVPVASERIPEADMPVVRDSLAPVYHFRTPVVYEVFASDGRFLGRVAFPPRARFIEADGDLVWTLVRNEDDLPAVVRFRITPGLQ